MIIYAKIVVIVNIWADTWKTKENLYDKIHKNRVFKGIKINFGKNMVAI